MKRVLSVLTVALVVAVMVSAMAVPALASPIGPGPNSYAPEFVGTGFNFGHCQSRFAKEPGSADLAQDENPAIFTKGDTSFGTGGFCEKF